MRQECRLVVRCGEGPFRRHELPLSCCQTASTAVRLCSYPLTDCIETRIRRAAFYVVVDASLEAPQGSAPPPAMRTDTMQPESALLHSLESKMTTLTHS